MFSSQIATASKIKKQQTVQTHGQGLRGGWTGDTESNSNRKICNTLDSTCGTEFHRCTNGAFAPISQQICQRSRLHCSPVNRSQIELVSSPTTYVTTCTEAASGAVQASMAHGWHGFALRLRIRAPPNYESEDSMRINCWWPNMGWCHWVCRNIILGCGQSTLVTF